MERAKLAGQMGGGTVKRQTKLIKTAIANVNKSSQNQNDSKLSKGKGKTMMTKGDPVT